MVTKILRLLGKEIGGLHEAAYLLGAFAILSQLLALVRDRLLAHSFGASHALDTYYAAFRIPDFIFVTIGSLVSVSVLIPFLVSKLEKSKEEAKEFIDNTFSAFSLIIISVSVIAFFFVPSLVKIIFPGFYGFKETEELILVTRILLLSPILLGVSNFLASITQVYNRFFIYALSPVLYNCGIIVGILVLAPRFGIMGLALGVVLGALFHVLVQVPFVISQGMFPKISLRAKFSSLKTIILVSLPRTITMSSNEIAESVLISFASLMSVGSISVFNFSFNLQSVPLSVIGVSYSLAAFPTLSRYFSLGDKVKYLEHMIVSTRHIIFLSMPVVALFVVLRAQIVRVILGSGAFNWSDTRLTAAALALFTLSLVPQSLVLLFVRAYYSQGNTRKPLFVNIFSAALIIFLGYYLNNLFTSSLNFRYFIEALFKVEDVVGSNVLMIPLAYSIGVTVNVIIHWIMFQKDYPGFSKAVRATLFQSFAAAIGMGFVSYISLNIFATIFDLDTFMGIFLQGFISGIIGIGAGICILILLKNKEIKEMSRALHHKFWKTPVIGPDPEVV